MLLFLLAACRQEPVFPEVSVDVDPAVPGVATVRWTSDAAAVGWVEYGAGNAFDRATPRDDGRLEHAIEVRGLAHGSHVALRAVEARAGGEVRAEALPLDIPAFADFPELTLSVPAADACPPGGYLLTTLLTVTGDSWLAIVDRDGAPVWALPGAHGDWLARARPSRDGAGVVVLRYDPFRLQDLGRIQRIPYRGSPVTETRAPQAHHDFLELSDGDFAWLGYVYAPQTQVDGVVRDVVTDAIFRAPEGSSDVETVFSVLTDFPPGLYDPGTTGVESGFVPGWWEFSHGNSLLASPDETTFYAMFRWLDAYLSVGPGGRYDWELGGRDDDFTGDPAALFDHAHLSERWDGGLLVFDNANATGVSGAVEYALDEERRTYEKTWEYRDPAGKLEFVLGDAIRVPGCDDVLIAWASSGRVDQVTRAGDVVWSLQAPPGWMFGRLSFLPTLYADAK